VPAGATELPTEAEYKYGDTVTAADKAEAPGYTFVGWKVQSGYTLGEGEEIVTTFPMPANDVALEGTFVANEDVKYTARYFFQDIDDEESYVEDEDLIEPRDDGKTDTELTADQLSSLVKSVPGFEYITTGNRYFSSEGELTAPTVQGDGSLEVHIYYNRKSYKVTYSYTNDPVPAGATELPAEAEYKYGQTVTLAADAEAPGYDFSGWKGNYEIDENGNLIEKILELITGEQKFIMPAADVNITGTFTAREDVKYTVQYFFQPLDGGEYVIDDNLTETKDNGVADQDLSETTLKSFEKEIEGFTYVEGGNKYYAATGQIQTPTVQGDGSLIVRLFYSRNSYKVT
ncbi:InlB B-repeat-containing protein, partial [Butyrivibrio sp. INlla14]|uniref:InlB B-repeat-containing protein n=1 Tax=Butyrivibrio sp. INlla14 TaxID=1520808 RepID=UPI0008767C03